MREVSLQSAMVATLVGWLSPLPARAQTVIYVDAAGGGGTGDGSSWASAYADLQDALDDAAADAAVSEVRVAQGTYRPDRGTRDAGLSFRLLNGVEVRGGFAGAGEADPDLWDPSTYMTVLSGDLAGDDATAGTAENALHVVDASGVDDSAVLDGFVIRGGNADAAAPHNSGGGMHNLSGRPTLLRCAFQDNSAAQHGGAVYNSGRNAVPTFTECSFARDSAGGRGGAVYNDVAGAATEPMTFFCLFRDNAASDGGAVFGFGGALVMLDCLLEQNSASAEGGAVYNFTNNAVFEGCTFTANSAVDGGALRNAGSRPALARCLFTGNTATDDGGALLNQNAGASLANCAFVGNSAGNEGGALWSFNALSFAVRNCTFSGNLAGDRGGALYNWGTTGGGSSPQLSSCVLWDNRDAGGSDESGQMHTDRGSPTLNYSCLQGLTGGPGGSGNIGLDPRLASDGWRLQPTSSCVDGGDPAYAASPGETDLDGGPRVLEGRVDMGADEFGMADADGDGVEDEADNCPAATNEGQENADGDDLGDACDACPNDAANDVDADGACGDVDNCPEAANEGQEDTDGDGGGDACDLDDDDDGLSDADEAAFGTNPRASDTDGDGMMDGAEADWAAGSGCPNPILADSDGDTLPDGEEADGGTNPCSADTDDDGVPDAEDPTPTEPGVPPEYLEDWAGLMATDTIPDLSLGLFNGPNQNANRGRRNALANRAAAAAAAIAAGDYETAINELESLLDRIDGESPPPDWMSDGPEKTALANEVRALIALLRLL